MLACQPVSFLQLGVRYLPAVSREDRESRANPYPAEAACTTAAASGRKRVTFSAHRCEE